MEISITKKRQADRLLFLGILLFLLGLVVGLFIPMMTNPRMGLAAHLEALMNGMFLVILGLLWNKPVLSERLFSIAFWLIVYSSFANVTAVFISAVTGFGKMLPLAGGQEGPPVMEGIISFLLVSLALAIIAVCAIVLKGLWGYMKHTD